MTEQKEIIAEEKAQRSYSCCGSGSSENEKTSLKENSTQDDDVRSKVREQYAAIATGESESIINSQETDGETSVKTSSDPGYTDYSSEELASIPKEANLGLGSGNPISLADIQIGETVVDLGSGAGIDCFLSAKKVGNSGKVIGIDMTPQMIDKARKNARDGGYENVEFRLGEIENIPVADNSVDLIVSNCVINLSVDKSKVFNEAFRILKPGGRLVVSDIVLNHEFPKVVKEALSNAPGCVSRAWKKEDYLGVIESAGFEKVELLEAANIPPRNKPRATESGLNKRKLIVSGKELEVELTPEEDKRLITSIMKGHIRAYKPN
ncbi:MAG: arsenite methyltransferase [Candidatus Hodarchaeales archaeon]|jgi:SAM-dependent methyltransferase